MFTKFKKDHRLTMPSCKTLIIKPRKLEARDILQDSKRRKEDQEIAFLFPHTPHLSMRSSRGETISDYFCLLRAEHKT